MATSPTHPGRRTYLIDRGFQLKYALLLGGMGGIVSLLFGLMIFLAHQEISQTLQQHATLAVELNELGTTLLWLTIGTAVLMAGALALFGILITHRVAGPIFVMNHYLAILSSGRFPKMRPLRKNDELKHLFEGLQTTVEFLRTREAAEADALEQALAALSGTAPSPVVDTLRALRDQKRAAVAPPATAPQARS